MKKTCFRLLLTAGTCAAVITLTAPAQATTTFGSLPGSTTFGGTGIATNNVEISTATSGADTITLGLEATPYGPQPAPVALPNNGTTSPTDVTYVSPIGASSANAARAFWNFDFYVGVSTGDFSSYTYDLTINNGTSSFSFDPTASAVGDTTIGDSLQNSENIDFFAFNPNAVAAYTIDLQVLSLSGAVIDNDQITVDAVPDTTSTLALTAMALGGLAIVSRKKLAGIAL
jgi:VPDSG-CTERM motif